MGLAMVLVAVRGIPFFALAAGAAIARMGQRVPAERALWGEDAPLHVVASATAATFAVLLGWLRLTAPVAYLSTQAGLGRSHGEWADAALAYLDAHPPPGRMLNVGWATGNALIWGEQAVFVDPRWEAYPRDFLIRSIEAMDDPQRFAAQVERVAPGWVVGEMRLPQVQMRLAELLATGDWGLAYSDAHLAIVVRGRGRAEPAHFGPTEDLSRFPVLHAQQHLRLARLACYLERHDQARSWLAEASPLRDQPAVAAEWGTLPEGCANTPP